MCFQAGILDVEAWMMSVDRRVLDFWEAYDRVEPLPDSWLQSAQICVQLEKLFAIQLAVAGGEDYEHLELKHFMPPRWTPPDRPEPPPQPAEEMTAILDRTWK